MSTPTVPARRRRILGPGDFNFRRYGDIGENPLHVQNVSRYEVVYEIYNGFICSLIDALIRNQISQFGENKVLLLPDICGSFCLLEAP